MAVLPQSNMAEVFAKYEFAHAKHWIEEELKRTVADVKDFCILRDTIEVDPENGFRTFVQGPNWTYEVTFTDASASSKTFPIEEMGTFNAQQGG